MGFFLTKLMGNRGRIATELDKKTLSLPFSIGVFAQAICCRNFKNVVI